MYLRWELFSQRFLRNYFNLLVHLCIKSRHYWVPQSELQPLLEVLGGTREEGISYRPSEQLKKGIVFF